jgi:pSer/pThr/pTyr-binding forkhead associated (FHA) protein
MDVFEKLNRTFGAWYEGLFGGGSDDADLRPRDILRRILRAMEDGRREGLDGQIYVPNHFTLDISVASDEERDYLRTFLDADELSAAVRRHTDSTGIARAAVCVSRSTNCRLCRPVTVPWQEPHRLAACRCAVASMPPSPRRASLLLRRRYDKRCRLLPVRFRLPLLPRGHGLPPRRRPAHGRAAGLEDPGTIPAFGVGDGSGGRSSRHARDRRGNGQSDETVALSARGAQVGRSRQAGNDVILSDDGMVSKRHARIEFVPSSGGGAGESSWLVRDLQSTNGTYVNEQPLPTGAARPLFDGDEIRIGATRLVFSRGGVAAARPSAVLPAANGAAAPRLVNVADGSRFALASEMSVGRALTSDILLADEGIAARHARLRLGEGGQVYVEDSGTETGTWVNGERIPPQFAVVVYPGDEIRFGRMLRFAWSCPGSSSSHDAGGLSDPMAGRGALRAVVPAHRLPARAILAAPSRRKRVKPERFYSRVLGPSLSALSSYGNLVATPTAVVRRP